MDFALEWNGLDIRLECWRLQGFTDERFYKAIAYKIAKLNSGDKE